MTLFDVPSPFAAHPVPETPSEPSPSDIEPLDGILWDGAEFLRADLVPLDELTTNGAGGGDPEVIVEALRARGQLRPVLVAENRRDVVSRGHLVVAARTLGWTHLAVRLKIADDLVNGNGQTTLVDLLDGADLGAFVPKATWTENEDAVDGINDASRDPDHEWVGLPEWVRGTDAIRIVVSVESEEDRQAFFDAVGIRTVHKITRGTFSVWWPDQVKKDLTGLRFVADES